MRKRKLRKRVKELYGKKFARGVFDKLKGTSVSFGNFEAGDALLYLKIIERVEKGGM